MAPIPERLKRFPLWLGRYPIHYTVSVKNGVPVFREVSRARQIEAVGKNLCHLCGQRMSAPYWFIVGEANVSALQTHDGPMHEECARYAIAACPFLANPNYVGKKPAIDGAGPSVAAALIAMDATGPVLRPPRLALCTAGGYRADVSSQYPIFLVSGWDIIDWTAIPSHPTVCGETNEAN